MEIIVENKKARFEFFLLEEFEAGIVLLSSEVKSLRERKANISDAYIIENNSEIWLRNMHIAEYKSANKKNHKIRRERKLLLRKKEISKLIDGIKIAGITVIPLSVYFNSKGLAKTKIAIAKGKKLYDKRAIIKQREWDREKNRFSKIEVHNKICF
ncbi:MAG: SsrA-binding protein SmpB [Wolbachia endosymbiont of Meromenopon meropis]|nr:SsrA-binding protein SmpB [Wolbachia endosymbiont of Meromenopon meropis]